MLRPHRALAAAFAAVLVLISCGSAAAEGGYTTGQFIRGNVLESAEGVYITAIGCPTATTGRRNTP